MKVAPVSADLLVKLGIVVLMGGAGWYLLSKLRASVSSGVDSLSHSLDTITAPIRDVSAWVGNQVDYFNEPYDPAKPRYAYMDASQGAPDSVVPFTTLADLFSSSTPAKPAFTGGATGSW